MDIYKTNEHRQQYHSTEYLGYASKFEQKTYTQVKPLPKLNYLRSPSQFVSSSVMVVHDAGRLSADYQGCFTMERDLPTALRSINESKLAEVVRKSINREKFRIQGWRARKLDGVDGNPARLGLYRFDGIGEDRKEWLDWSILLKVIQSPQNVEYAIFVESEDQTHWNYWKRELLLYQSGWLETLPEGLSAPRCYEAEQLPGNIAGMWLEDITDSFQGPWPLYRYALTARHLGRLNGVYISRRELPSYPWLSFGRTREWLRSIPWRDFPWDHPRVRQQFPSVEVNSFRTMLEESEKFLSKLNQIPQTVSHGDTFPANFRSRRSHRSQEQTVALDWALAGIEPVGDDLGPLVYGTHLNLKGYKLQDISHTLLTSYIHGLEDSGCRIDPKLVRFGYTAAAAFRIGLFKMVRLMEKINKDEEVVPRVILPPVNNDPFESFMADEAYKLLDVI